MPYKRGRPKKGEVRPQPAKPKTKQHTPKTLNCLNCIVEKRYCNRERPCRRCVRRNIQCLYNDPEERPLGPTTPNPTFSQKTHLLRLRSRMAGNMGQAMVESGRLPDSNLLDHIHNAASRHLVTEPLKPLYSLDGSALLLFGIVAEEMIEREAEAIREFMERGENVLGQQDVVVDGENGDNVDAVNGGE